MILSEDSKDDALMLVDQAAIVPVAPKKKRIYLAPTKEKGNSAKKTKEIAVEILKKAFEDQDSKRKTFLERASKDNVPVLAVLEAFKHFEGALGGRGELIKALHHCPPSSPGYHITMKLLEDKDFLEVAKGKGDKENVRLSIAAICRRHRIPFNSIVTAFRDGKTAQLAFEALTTVSGKVPIVVEQMAEDAQNHWAECPVCEGKTKMPRVDDMGEWLLDSTGVSVMQNCWECRGKGKVWKEHDFQNRKAFLQITKVLEERAPLVQQTFNQQANIGRNFIPGDGAFEKLVKAIDGISRPITTNVEDLEPIDV